MSQELKFNIRKASAMEFFAILITFATICAVGFGINLFVKKSPVAFLDPWFIGGAVLFTVLGIWYYISQKAELVISINDNGERSISIYKNKQSVLGINNLDRMKAYFVKVPVSARQTMNELQLAFYNNNEEHPTLILSHSLGKIYALPKGFEKEVPFRTIVANHTFFCSKVENVKKILDN